MIYPFYTKNEEDENGDEIRNEVMIPHHLLNFTEAPSMVIDDVMDILIKMKEKGADRIYIAQHGDHHNYIFYGIKLLEI